MYYKWSVYVLSTQSKCNIVSKVLFIKQKVFAFLVLILLLKNNLHVAFNTLFIVNALFYIGFTPQIINYMILIILKCTLFYTPVFMRSC